VEGRVDEGFVSPLEASTALGHEETHMELVKHIQNTRTLSTSVRLKDLKIKELETKVEELETRVAQISAAGASEDVEKMKTPMEVYKEELRKAKDEYKGVIAEQQQQQQQQRQKEQESKSTNDTNKPRTGNLRNTDVQKKDAPSSRFGTALQDSIPSLFPSSFTPEFKSRICLEGGNDPFHILSSEGSKNNKCDASVNEESKNDKFEVSYKVDFLQKKSNLLLEIAKETDARASGHEEKGLLAPSHSKPSSPLLPRAVPKESTYQDDVSIHPGHIGCTSVPREGGTDSGYAGKEPQQSSSSAVEQKWQDVNGKGDNPLALETLNEELRQMKIELSALRDKRRLEKPEDRKPIPQGT